MTVRPAVWTIDNVAWPGAAPRLSVLIPFLRDDPRDLLKALDQEARWLFGAVEIVVLDDGGGDDVLAAAVAETIEGAALPARFVRLAVNEGRSRGRNRLAANARATHYLFLDADMAPDSPSFLRRWLEVIEASAPAVAFGGFTLNLTPVSRDRALHRALALRGECRPAAVRRQEAEKSVCTSNLLVRSDVFAAEAFDEGFNGWGWEDVEWATRVSRRWPVVHLDNTASHLGLDTDTALLGKYAQSPANFARMAERHPDVVAAFPSYRLARALQHAPARPLFTAIARTGALFPVLPMGARALAAKLYRALLYADALA